MEATTKKYLIGAGVLVGGYLIYLRARHNAKSSSDKKTSVTPKKTTIATPPAIPSTAGQFNPVGLPASPYPSAYPPSYIPPGPGYIPPVGYPSYPPQYPGYPTTYAQPYPTPYPGTYTGYPVSGVNCQAAAASVIGLNAVAARQRLASLGIQTFITNTPISPYTTTGVVGGNSVSLYVTGGIVRNASCGSVAY